MSNTDIKTRAKQVLRDASTEEDAVKNLEYLGLVDPTVTFSAPNAAGQMMKMDMAYYGEEVIIF